MKSLLILWVDLFSRIVFGGRPPMAIVSAGLLFGVFGQAMAFAEGHPAQAAVAIVQEEVEDYDTWLTHFLDESQIKSAEYAAKSADPDGDGLSNYFEFIAKLDPMDRESRFLMEFVDHNVGRLRFGPIYEEVEFDLLFSRDLETWDYYEPEQYAFVDNIFEVDLGDLGVEIFFNIELNRDVPIPILVGFTEIRAGEFTMGSPPSEPGRDDEELFHNVVLTRSFFMAQTEVTWKQWNEVRDEASTYGYTDIGVGRNGRNGDASGMHPVTFVVWEDCIKWCNLRSELEGKTPVYYSSSDFGSENVFRNGSVEVFADWDADGYRLPTEAEWEYCCRSGTSFPYFAGGRVEDIEGLDASLDPVGWYDGNSDLNTHKAEQKLANGQGLYDMHGNVWEWCWDKYGPYEVGDVTDPTGDQNEGVSRVLRGGGWSSPAEDCRSAKRVRGSSSRGNNAVGFRVVYNSTQ